MKNKLLFDVFDLRHQAFIILEKISRKNFEQKCEWFTSIESLSTCDFLSLAACSLTLSLNRRSVSPM